MMTEECGLCLVRYSRGVMPHTLRKTALNRLMEENPELNATSSIFMEEVVSKCWA